MFSDLYTASFDADADTLARLQLLRQLNACLSQWIEMVGWKLISFHEWIIIAILPTGVSEEQPSGDDVPGPNGDRLRAESAQVEGGIWHRGSGERRG